MDLDPILVGRKTGARLLAISVRKLDYLISAGELKVRKIGKRVLLDYRSLCQFARGRK